MVTRLFGFETELAFAAATRDGEAHPRGDLIQELFAHVGQRVPSLPDMSGNGVFLANGARFYLDQGQHPEICTPECQTPEELVRWQLACERLLTELTAELGKRHPELELALFRCNVDYSGTGSTWGCHESYQHHGQDHASLAPNVIPHFVTRIVYTGSGGFDNTKGSLEFLLSPRVPHLVQEIGGDGSTARGIYNTRNEPLSQAGFSRMHVVCGESLCSELGNYLKVGTTALVVRLVEAGACRGRGLAFRSPVEAMRSFARDPSFRAKAELLDGRRLTALEVQTEYLNMVEEKLGAEFMPEWAPAVCARWRQVLEALSAGPDGVATSLDWAIKYAIFRDRQSRSSVRRPFLRRASGLGAELCEIDTRFGQLSEASLFRTLDASGALDHRIVERGSVEAAVQEAPLGTRAEARGRAVLELREVRENYTSNWDAIHELRSRRFLDLGDPFEVAPTWKEFPQQRPRRQPGGNANTLRRLLARGIDYYHTLDLARAVAVLDPTIRRAQRADEREAETLARFWCACAYQDGGALDSARRVAAPAVDEAPGVSPDTRIRLLTRYALILLERPAPLAEIEQAIESARSVSRSADRGHSRVSSLEARLLGARGRHAEAIETYDRTLRERASDPIAFAPSAYLRWLLTYLLREGRLEDARFHLAAWRNDLGAGGLVSYDGVSLVCAESELALRSGRPAEALEHARLALAHSDGFRRHRCRLMACAIFLRSAAAAQDFAGTDAVLRELRGWRRLQIRSLRLELRCAEAAVQRARAAVLREQEAAEPLLPWPPGSRPGSQAALIARGAARARRLARREAEVLDEALETTHHVRELDAALPGFSRPQR